MFFACECRKYSQLSALLDSGLDINLRNKSNESLLHIACRARDIHMIQFLLDHNIDVTLQDNYGDIPLSLACTQGFEEEVRALIPYYKTTNFINARGYTPLHLACLNKHKKIVELLLKKDKSNIDVLTHHGDSALHIACDKRCKNIVSLLIYHGAKLDRIKNDFHNDILNLLCKYSKNDISKYINDLLQQRTKQLLGACANNKIGVIKDLLSLGVDVNTQGEKGFTPLMDDCKHNHLSAVKLLLENGAKIDVETNGRIYAAVVCLCKQQYRNGKTFAKTQGQYKL